MATKRRRKTERAVQYENRTYRQLLRRLARATKGLRKKRGWTQEEAAHQCGMSTRLYQQVESEETNATLTTLARLAEGFEVDVLQLLPRKRPRRLD